MKLTEIELRRNPNGEFIYTYWNDDYNYIIMKQLRNINGREELITRRIKGTIDELHDFMHAFTINGTAKGIILIRDFLESTLPNTYKERLNHKKSYEKAITEFIRINPANDSPIKINNERVLRFTDWIEHPTGGEADIIVQLVYA